MKRLLSQAGMSAIAVAVIIVVIVLVAGGAYYFYTNNQPVQNTNTPTNTSTADSSDASDDSAMKNDMAGTGPSATVSLSLSAQSGSAQSGTAVITKVDQKTKVTIVLTAGAAGVAQPAHIHAGACPTPGAVKYPLTSVTNGISETILNVSYDALLGQLPLAINVHKSAAEVATYVACGDIKTPTTNPSPNDTKTDDTPKETVPPVTGASQTRTFNLTAQNFSFSLSEIRVKKGDTVIINLDVVSGFHDWVIDEFSAHTQQVGGGSKTSVQFVADKAGTFEYYCSVGSHRQMGMKGKLVVE